MAERGLARAALGAIREGFRDFQRELKKTLPRENLRDLVRELRQIPADDRRKKDELAKYFQSDDGRNHTTQEKFLAYSELLGVRANRHRG